MTSSIRLGRIAGIEISVNWTWFLVVILMTWSLAVSVFPHDNPGHSDAAYWLMGLIAALLFFASILLHELGHALQARRDDVAIEGITLWLFGGVARFRGMYRSPGVEFRVAIAGPVVTLVIGGALVALGAAIPLPDVVDGVVTWLGVINLTLLVFNLLPALPLDGGRLLHAVLWRLRGDLMWATRTAGAIGAGFGWLLIGGGTVLFFAGNGFSGLWLVVLGWFLQAAAGAEVQQTTAREALRGRTVRELMVADPVTVPANMTLGRFMDDVAQRTRYTTYPVVDDGHPVGLLTFSCVAERPRARWDGETVRACMLPRERVPVVSPDEDASEALDALTDDPRRALVIDDADRLVGLLSISDVLRAIERSALRRYGNGHTAPA
jgi:Zn-dependent protease/CBS domain-containing protein